MSITSAGDVTTATEVFLNPPQYFQPPFTVTVTWTNLGPLTTTFRAPASCSTGPTGALTVFDYRHPSAGIVGSGICQLYNFGIPPWIDCQPSRSFYESNYWGTLDVRTPYFSPGIFCPADYSTADVFVLAESDVSTASLDGNTLRTTGTHVFCCPSGFTSSLYSCWSSVTTATSTSLCGDDTCAKASYVSVLNGSSTITQYACSYTPLPFSWDPSQQAVTVQQELSPVYMIHQQSDIPRKGHPTTAKIVIGVIVPIVVLFAVFVGGFCFMRRSKKRRQLKSNAQPAISLHALGSRKYRKRPAASGWKFRWV